MFKCISLFDSMMYTGAGEKRPARPGPNTTPYVRKGARKK